MIVYGIVGYVAAASKHRPLPEPTSQFSPKKDAFVSSVALYSTEAFVRSVVARQALTNR
jgi:hypothetical protein